MTEGSGEVRELPRGWCYVPLGMLGELARGKSKHRPRNDPKLYGDLIPFIQTGEVAHSKGRIHSFFRKYSEFGINQSRIFPKGSICITIAANIANTGILGFDACFPDSIVGLIIDPSLANTYFIEYFFRKIRQDLIKLAPATAQANINLEILNKVAVLLPPLNEQNRIVEKIEELFSELDQGIESLKTAQKQLKVYRQAVLKWAFEGKLTEEWRKQHSSTLKTGEALLAQIEAERENRYQQQLAEWETAVKEWEAIGKVGKKPTKPQKLKELLPLTKPELAELPEIPGDWRWVKLGSISTSIRIGPFGSLLHKSDYVSNQIPAINPSHIKNLKILPDLNQTITPEKFAELGNYALKEGDIIMGRRGEMGRCAVVTQKENEYLCGTGSLFIRLVDILDSYFYCLILSSRRVKTYLENASIGTTMQNLNEDILHDVPIPLCNPDEQDKILEEIESRLSICDQLEATIIENLQKAEALRQSILKQAFEGKLVPQDPNDEPAEKLLERIKAEQEATQPKNSKQLKIKGL